MDSRRKARLVENATNQCDVAMYNPQNASLSGDARACASCGQTVGSRSGVLGNWDAFPAGVKFDPSDEELLHHLRAEIGHGTPHPLIKNFISDLDGEEGICQTHPENLPGVKKDGSSRHFFHRPAKAYTTGTRKRRKIHSEDDEPGVETRWHKTGKTRPVLENGEILGWKKIMVLYKNTGAKKSKPEKTNWILHQYHLGKTEEETDGELVVCKVFYQKQPRQCTGGGGRQAEGFCEMENVDLNQGSKDVSVTCLSEVSRGTPVTPKVDTPQRPRSARGEATGRMRGAVSGKGSELTVIGTDTQAAFASELTSTPVPYPIEAVTPARSFVNVEHFSTPAMKVVQPMVADMHPMVAENYSTGWNDASYEEVSTSGKSCQNETDNQVGGGVEPVAREQNEQHQFPMFGGESQQPGVFDNDMEISFSLLCNEASDWNSLDWASEFSPMEDLCISNPHEDYPHLDILSDSVPHIDADLQFSSQEARAALGTSFLDNDDSLSST